MIEMLLALILVIMAKKKGRKRSFRRYLRGAVEVLGDLSALGAGVVVEFAMVGGGSVNERTFVSSIKCSWVLSNLTEQFSDGPIVVGVAHSDYSVSEIEAWLENAGSWDEGNLVQQEIAKRKIRRVGVFETPAQALGMVSLNDGRQITTKCGWILNQGQTLHFWAWNSGSSALATTAPELAVSGHANLWPR